MGRSQRALGGSLRCSDWRWGVGEEGQGDTGTRGQREVPPPLGKNLSKIAQPWSRGGVLPLKKLF